MLVFLIGLCLRQTTMMFNVIGVIVFVSSLLVGKGIL